jgi:hypothetical protein
VLLTALVGLMLPAAGAAAADGGSADRVVIVGVAGLTWDDVDAETTPQLWELAEQAPIGALSVRAARSTTCVLDGWATLGAGNRAGYPEPEIPAQDDGQEPRPDPSLPHCGRQERVAADGLADPAATVARIAADEGSTRYGAEPGALGAAVGCAAVSGRAAALAVAVDGVQVTHADPLPADPAELGTVLDGCPLSLVSLDALTGDPGAEGDDGIERRARTRALAGIDEEIGRLHAAVAQLPGDTLLVVAGIAEVGDDRPRLHVGIVSGPGFASPAWLSSASTGRAPFLQLIDLAPTALTALDLDRPASMNGQPLRASGERPGLAEAVAELRRADTAATVHHRTVGTFFWTLVAVSAALVALGVHLLGRSRESRPPSADGAASHRLLRTLALAVAALPVATYLAGLVPWEATGVPVLALGAAVVGADLAVLAVALLGPWRRHRIGPPLAVLAVTFGTLVTDVVTGSHLELDGLLGYDPIVAGRFTGYGNLSFGLLSVSALLLTAAAATALGRRTGPTRAPRVSAGVVLAVGFVTVAVIGAPGLGRDFGGVLAALPGFLLLAMLLAHVRVTVPRLAAVLGAAVVAVATVAVLDWLRPADERSHLGRFVEQILTGEAWTVVSRKAQANLGILLGSALAWMLPVALAAAVWLVRPGGLLRRAGSAGSGPGGLSAQDLAALRSALIASALSLTLGTAVNDSGIAVPATAAALLVPLLIWLAAGGRRGGPGKGEVADGTPRSGPVDDPGRVTVVSRGSTVGNA